MAVQTPGDEGEATLFHLCGVEFESLLASLQPSLCNGDASLGHLE
jgi:hypothetical protein